MKQCFIPDYEVDNDTGNKVSFPLRERHPTVGPGTHGRHEVDRQVRNDPCSDYRVLGV